MTPFRTVGARLSFALLLLVAAALAIVYLIVVPSLERSLVDDKRHRLEGSVTVTGLNLPSASIDWPFYAQDQAIVVNARVVVFVYSASPPSVLPYADSLNRFDDVQDDPVALRAAREGQAVSAVVSRAGRRVAEAAFALGPQGPVVLAAADLGDVSANVARVRHRLFLAALVAVAASLLVGLVGARLFARRIRRLERAADRITRGDFDEPVVDGGADELGELAEAFDRMRRQLARYDRARGEFIANASHELRTPLFSLAGFLELLSDEELDEETKHEFLQTMREQVNRLTRLATDLLDLSRLDAGQVRLDVAELDLSALAEMLVMEFGPLARVEEHVLEATTNGRVPAFGDEERVLQVGRLLIENAIRHTPPGTRVVVCAGSDGIAARLSVENDGPPIPTEHSSQIFERFYRVEGSRASGSGLGLAIARELAELMGGRIQLDSKSERTAFTLVLPAPAATREQPELSTI